ncbi:unnamed protein product [Protopolystoma xenopodis]|uniref:Uncharacterized protein n=1 Tax=Protopolystoma xenopodis TaxID=117903 RepID=A0A448WH24_9PLAT|nr:unnamed protein product [Protopolystoma xenopodis]
MSTSCEHVGISEPSPVSPFLDPDFYEGLPSDSISLSIKGCAPPPEKQKNQLKLAKKSLSLEDRQSLERNDDSSTAGLSLSESDSGRKDHLQIQITENRPETLPDYIQGGLASDPDYILWMPPSGKLFVYLILVIFLRNQMAHQCYGKLNKHVCCFNRYTDQ